MARAHWSELPDDWSDDEKLAGDFLAGWPETVDGKIVHKFFEPDSEEEKAAQAALVRVLWDPGKPLNWALRTRIAALLDPAHQLEARKITIQNRKGGEQRDYRTEIMIVGFILEKKAEGCTTDAAIAAAEEHFHVSGRTAWRVWGDHKALRERS